MTKRITTVALTAAALLGLAACDSAETIGTTAAPTTAAPTTTVPSTTTTPPKCMPGTSEFDHGVRYDCVEGVLVEAEVLPTTPEAPTTTEPPATTKAPTTTDAATTTMPVALTPTQRETLTNDAMGWLWGTAMIRAAALTKNTEDSRGPLWAPNGQSSKRALACAWDRVSDFEMIPEAVDATIDQHLYEHRKFEAINPGQYLAEEVESALGIKELGDMGTYFTFLCAGYNDADARRIAGI